MRYVEPQELKQFLESVEYRHPNVAMALFWHPFEGYRNICLAIGFTCPNSYKQGEIQKQNVNVPVPPIVSQKHFNDWLKWRLQTISNHELNELFWVNGKIAVDPHSESYWEMGHYL